MMSFETEEYVLDDESERLENKKRELAATVSELDPENPAFSAKVEEGNQVDRFLAGVEFARAEDGLDAETITLKGLPGGRVLDIKNYLEDEIRQRGVTVQNNWREAVYVVAFGTVDAPYIDEGMTDTERIEAIDEAASLPYLKWAEQRINDLGTVGNGPQTSFTDLVLEMRGESPETSTQNS